MANSILRAQRFKIIFTASLLAVIMVHAFVLSHYGFTYSDAIADSIVTNLFLASAALLITLTLQYYNPRKNRYVYLLGIVVALSILSLLVSRGILFFILEGTADYQAFFSDSFVLRYIFGLLIIACVALVSVLWYTIQDQQEAEQRKTEAERLSKEAELFNLRRQLQPHFLFNSLNSINALIGSAPQQARTMIQQLADFLRGTLKKEENQWVSVSDELQHLQLYLEIEKVRFGHRLQATITNNAPADARIPVLIMQPLVENSIKYGLYDNTGNISITINAWQEGSDLKLQVTNPFDKESSAGRKGTGFGLSSVERRLYLLFGRKNLLQTTIEQNNFITTITVPPHVEGSDHR